MGQAFRRASGKIRAADSSPKTAVDRRPPPPTNTDKGEISRKAATHFDNQDSLGSEREPRVNPDNVLEERDPQFDAMLSQMVGRITAKPGGKLEMGGASVVEKHNRPMPKLRNTEPDSGRYEQRLVPPGTLNVAQLRHIMLLHQGKADDHNGPMNVQQIAEKFRLEVAQVQRILQFTSLPSEDSNQQKS